MLDLRETLRLHALWRADNPAGRRANLTGANLTGADLTRAILTGAILTGAILTGSNLTRANLTGANLTGANLDYSSLPLWCMGLGATVDDRLARQFCYHALHYALSVDAPGITPELLAWVNEFHRVGSEGVPTLEPR